MASDLVLCSVLVSMLLNLLMVRLFGWLVLLSRADASKAALLSREESGRYPLTVQVVSGIQAA